MSTPAHSPKPQPNDRCTPQTLVHTIKALHAIVVSLMADQAALRRTMLEDPAFALSYQVHLKAATITAKPLLTEALDSYDALLEDVSLFDDWMH